MKKMISDRYMLMSSLGEGGMADVYLALDTILNREVAVKILRGEFGGKTQLHYFAFKEKPVQLVNCIIQML